MDDRIDNETPIDNKTIVETQYNIIKVLVDVVQKLQDNDVLNDEYFMILTRGMIDSRAKRIDQILQKRDHNTLEINHLLETIRPQR